MSFSKEWEKAYKNNSQQSIWPWSDLVSYVMRYSKPTTKKFRVLELGCGAGANIPFFKGLGVEYFGTDGSKTTIKMLKEKFPKLSDKLAVGDFTKEIPFDQKFDLIVDRASLTHNTTESIVNCINNIILPKLKNNGKFIGIDWFSTKHDDYKKGIKIEDDLFTAHSFQEGQFQGIGLTHFTDEKLIKKLFKDFEVIVLEHKVNEKKVPDHHIFAAWNFVAVKK